MACQAIIRRKRYLLDHLSRPLRPCSSFSRFGHGGYTHDTHTRIPHQVSEWSPSEAESSGRRWDALIRAKEDLTGFYEEFFQHPSGGIPISGFGCGKQEFVLPFAFRGLVQSVRATSTATAGQPVMPSEEEPDKRSDTKTI
ncbi:hypothetical protein C4D60_Mb01t04790 [Musa balbisiana]|uniref:Uncharacterized protein n=1 Tax=Musa balbisiana TaxID=52838 RepID=A0A4S8JLW8_MUSBA|nr:hypothetical protein C4D60_Mb01t04790 [Musa balbisiana]